MNEVKCPKCNANMTPCKRKRRFYFACVRNDCDGTRSIHVGAQPAPDYAVANAISGLTATVERLVEQLKSEDLALRGSISHVKRIDVCIADYWKGKAR